MDIKKTFLDATKQLIPYQMENLMEPLLPAGVQKDSVGNYFIKIGESRTMFTCHLDSYCKKLHDVVHVLYDNGKKVKTNGKTPLGGDDKTGMVIMLNMIEHKVPGHYFFFIGEEPTLSGGVYGSRTAHDKSPEFFQKGFDRVIAFDRKGYSSIISRQRGHNCCSKEFVDALSAEFAKQGLTYKDDPTGYYTDSAVFMYTVPEITNLSCGGFDEHKVTEWVDLEYLEKLANACCKINWESLPIKRDPTKHKPRPKEKVPTRLNNEKGVKLFNFRGFVKKTGYDLYKTLRDYFQYFYLIPVPGQKFLEGRNVVFVKDPKESQDKTKYNVRVKGTQIWLNNKKIGSLDNFERTFNIGFDCKFYKHSDEFINDLKSYCDKYNTTKIPFKDVQIILKTYGNFTVNELLFNLETENAVFDEEDFIIDDVNKCLIIE